MSSAMFKGRFFTCQDILDAMSRFDAKYPNTNDFTGRQGALKGWLENRTFEYAVRHRGRLYPPKYILSKASGVPRYVFSGGSQTNRVFRELGFEVIEKTATVVVFVCYSNGK